VSTKSTIITTCDPSLASRIQPLHGINNNVDPGFRAQEGWRVNSTTNTFMSSQQVANITSAATNACDNQWPMQISFPVPEYHQHPSIFLNDIEYRPVLPNMINPSSSKRSGVIVKQVQQQSPALASPFTMIMNPVHMLKGLALASVNNHAASCSSTSSILLVLSPQSRILLVLLLLLTALNMETMITLYIHLTFQIICFHLVNLFSS
jgi:hypothetical protein